MGGVTIRWGAWAGLVLIVVLGACGSNPADRTGTELTIDGVSTTGFVAADPSGSASGPIPKPGDAIEIDISGSLRCNGHPSGTGMYAANAAQLCGELSGQSTLFDQIADNSSGDKACAEVYGGPQHATIKGTVDGNPVDVEIRRTDGCGIDNWQQLEWLLGPPER
jgi:hypothetical protein